MITKLILWLKQRFCGHEKQITKTDGMTIKFPHYSNFRSLLFTTSCIDCGKIIRVSNSIGTPVVKDNI